MKRHKVDSQRERRILTALVVSPEFLSQAAPVINLDLVESELFRVVAKWCTDYYQQYGKAPGSHVEDMYHKWSEDNDNKDLVEAVKDFVEVLGTEYEKAPELNVPYLVDQLRDFLAKRNIIRLKETIEYSMSRGETPEAENAIIVYRKIEVGQGAGFNLLNDNSALKQAFASPSKPIICFDGDAGKFFNHALTRDALVGIQAPEKTGKTYWCIEFCVQALRQRRKVALFEVGDLSASQITKRFMMRWAQLPLWKNQVGDIPMPVAIEFDEALDIGYSFKTAMKHAPEVLNRKAAREGRDRFRRACGMADSTKYIMTSIHASGTATIRDIESILDRWEQDHSFVPDVVVIDYPDILAPENPKVREPRDKVNDTWLAMRRLSQQRHVLVLAPTQTKAAVYGRDAGALQSMDDFSEDKRKYAHVTAMMGLNQTWGEKEIGGMRVNWLVVREAPFSQKKPLYVGTCFALGKTICCSSFADS